MAYLEWQSNLEVGLEQVDDDHRTLVATLNELRAAMDQGRDQTEIAKVLHFLRGYTVSHFSKEEALMIRHGFPGAPAHFIAHADLLLEVSDFSADYRLGDIASAEDMMAFLEKWLIQHIQGQDRELGLFLKSRGVVG